MSIGMIFLLLVVWIALSVFILRFGSPRSLKVVAIACCPLLAVSVYYNVHFYNGYRQSAVFGMMGVVGHLDAATELLRKGDNVGAALEVASAGGAMKAVSQNSNADINVGGANVLNELGSALEDLAPTITSSNNHSTRAIQFVEYADETFDQAKKYPQYPLSLLSSQLQEIAQHIPPQ